eukprot:7270341-Prymnesium_polylepis.1
MARNSADTAEPCAGCAIGTCESSRAASAVARLERIAAAAAGVCGSQLALASCGSHHPECSCRPHHPECLVASCGGGVYCNHEPAPPASGV